MPPSNSTGLTILVAEDDPDLLRIFRETLRFRGFTVREARNGEECLESAREVRPDLVILDIMMPVLDGIGAAARLRAEPGTARVPILALTALADPEVFRRALRAGCDLVLNKPIAPGDLLRGILCLLYEQDPAGGDPEQFASEERSAAADLVSRGAEAIRALSAGTARLTDAELRQRLQGMEVVPACTSCGRVRTAAGTWREIPQELRAFFDEWMSVSHAVCPDCFARDYPDFPRPPAEGRGQPPDTA